MIIRSVTFLLIAIIALLISWRWENWLKVRRDRKALEVEHLLVTGQHGHFSWLAWQAVGWCVCHSCTSNHLDGRPWGHV